MPSHRAHAGALLLVSFLATGLAAPVVHQAWHRPDHVHGPVPAVAPPAGRHAHLHTHGGATAHAHAEYDPVRAGDRAPAPKGQGAPPGDHAPRPHDHVPAAAETDHRHPEGGPPEIPASPGAPDHGAGSIAHFALGMLAAPAPLALPAPAEAIGVPPARPYASRRGLVVRPRASRAPPA